MEVKIRDAEERDIENISRLLKYYASLGVILERDREDIRSNLESFIVAEISGAVIGAAAFYDYGENLKEVRSMAVQNDFLGKGIGGKLLNTILKRIKEKSAARISVLTYRPDFFKHYGFYEVSREEFPEKIWKDCAKCKDRDNCSETALVYKY